MFSRLSMRVSVQESAGLQGAPSPFALPNQRLSSTRRAAPPRAPPSPHARQAPQHWLAGNTARGAAATQQRARRGKGRSCAGGPCARTRRVRVCALAPSPHLSLAVLTGLGTITLPRLTMRPVRRLGGAKGAHPRRRGQGRGKRGARASERERCGQLPRTARIARHAVAPGGDHDPSLATDAPGRRARARLRARRDTRRGAPWHTKCSHRAPTHPVAMAPCAWPQAGTATVTAHRNHPKATAPASCEPLRAPRAPRRALVGLECLIGQLIPARGAASPGAHL